MRHKLILAAVIFLGMSCAKQNEETIPDIDPPGKDSSSLIGKWKLVAIRNFVAVPTSYRDTSWHATGENSFVWFFPDSSFRYDSAFPWAFLHPAIYHSKNNYEFISPTDGIHIHSLNVTRVDGNEIHILNIDVDSGNEGKYIRSN